MNSAISKWQGQSTPESLIVIQQSFPAVTLCNTYQCCNNL